MKLTGAATVLLVTDVRRAVEYYRDRLGFETSLWEPNPEHYGYASRDGCHLHFACFSGAPRRPPNAELVPPDMFDVYAWTDDVETLHAELVERGADVVQPPTDQGYGLRDIRVRDPFGYVIAFGEPLG